MYNQNIKNENLTNEELCVCETSSISEREAAIIDKVIATYAPLMDRPEHWVTLDEFEERLRRTIN